MKRVDHLSEYTTRGLFRLVLNAIEEVKVQMSKATDDLTREVAETREAVMAKLALMQAEIDKLLANPADETAVIAAAEALNKLQSDLTAVVEPPVEVPPAEPPVETPPAEPPVQEPSE